MVQSLHVLESALLLFGAQNQFFYLILLAVTVKVVMTKMVPSFLLEFSSFTFLNNFILKYFEEPFNNSTCLQYDILYIKVEVVNNVDFVNLETS